jgi:two-component system LytT family response regulator
MRKIKLLLVEDDAYSRRTAAAIIASNFPEIYMVDMVDNVASARKAIARHRPDLLVLDIELVDGTSFDLLKQVHPADFKVVFVSSYHKYVMEALQFSSVDFVFKPFDVNDLVVAIDKAIEELKEKNDHIKLETLFQNMEQQTGEKQIILQGETSMRPAKVSEIIWAKAIKGGARFYFTDHSFLFVPKPLRRYEAILNSHDFIRCHPHHLVNLRHVKFMDEMTNQLILKNGNRIDIEPRKKLVLKNALNSPKIPSDFESKIMV